MVVRYATFHNEPGYAIRTADMQVLFVDHAAQGTLLHDEDAAYLVLLGDLNLAVGQRMADALLGNAPAICTARRMEVQ